MYLALLAGVLLCEQSRADEQRGPYVGTALHRAKFDVRGDSVLIHGLEGDDVALKLIGGYRLSSRLAIEATYLDVGDENGAASGVEASGGDVAALTVGAARIWTVGKLEMYGKLGLSYWQSELRYDQAPKSRDAGIDPWAGVGLQHRMGRLTLRADFDLLWLRLSELGGVGRPGWVETYSVGAVFGFPLRRR